MTRGSRRGSNSSSSMSELRVSRGEDGNISQSPGGVGHGELLELVQGVLRKNSNVGTTFGEDGKSVLEKTTFKKVKVSENWSRLPFNALCAKHIQRKNTEVDDVLVLDVGANRKHKHWEHKGLVGPGANHLGAPVKQQQEGSPNGKGRERLGKKRPYI